MLIRVFEDIRKAPLRQPRRDGILPRHDIRRRCDAFHGSFRGCPLEPHPPRTPPRRDLRHRREPLPGPARPRRRRGREPVGLRSGRADLPPDALHGRHPARLQLPGARRGEPRRPEAARTGGWPDDGLFLHRHRILGGDRPRPRQRAEARRGAPRRDAREAPGDLSRRGGLEDGVRRQGRVRSFAPRQHRAAQSRRRRGERRHAPASSSSPFSSASASRSSRPRRTDSG